MKSSTSYIVSWEYKSSDCNFGYSWAKNSITYTKSRHAKKYFTTIKKSPEIRKVKLKKVVETYLRTETVLATGDYYDDRHPIDRGLATKYAPWGG
jgi:hypothetical protein